MKLSDQPDFVRVCYYGDPGSGKTSAAAMAANLGTTWFALAEPGVHRRPLEKLGVPVDMIHLDTDVSFDGIQARIDKIRTELHVNPGQIGGFVIDTVTEMTRQWLGEIVDAKANKERQKAEARGEEYDRNPFFIDRDYYSQTTQMWQRVLRALSDLETNVVFTAHVRRDVDDDDGSVKYGPDLPPAMQSHLTGLVDVLVRTQQVGAYSDGRPILVGRTSNAKKYRVKDRLNCLPVTMVYPSVDRINAYASGKLNEDNDTLQLEFRQWVESNKKEK